MIPEIARTQQNRNQLSLFKNSAQFVAYIISFIVTYFALRAGRGTTVEKTGPHDAYRFRVSIFLKFEIIANEMKVIVFVEYLLNYRSNWHFHNNYFPIDTYDWWS